MEKEKKQIPRNFFKSFVSSVVKSNPHSYRNWILKVTKINKSRDILTQTAITPREESSKHDGDDEGDGCHFEMKLEV